MGSNRKYATSPSWVPRNKTQDDPNPYRVAQGKSHKNI